VSVPPDLDPEGVTLARTQVRDVMKRCDELIQRVELALSRMERDGNRTRPPKVGCRLLASHMTGGERLPCRGRAANSN
jgi:hypothetical protein